MGITLDGFPCVDTGQLLNACHEQNISTSSFAGKANSFLVPGAEGCGRGWCLLLRSTLNQIDVESLHAFSFKDDQGGSVTFSNLVMIKADAITPGIANDPNTVFVCELADPRWLIHNPFYSFHIDAQYNLRVPSGGDTVYYPYTCQGGTGTTAHTWQTMLDDVWSTFSMSITDPISGDQLFENIPTPQLPFTADGTPEKFCFQNVSAWLAYNSIIKRLASRLVPNDMTFTSFSIVPINDMTDPTAIAFQNAYNNYFALRMYDSECIDTLIARTPSTLTVAFHAVHKHHGGEATASAADSSSFAQWKSTPYYTIDEEAGDDIDPGTGTRGLVWDDLSAINDPFSASTIGQDNFTNTTLLQSRADERANDYFTAISQSQSLLVQFSGVIGDFGLLPGSLVSGYAVYNRGFGYTTEVYNSAAPLSVSADGTWEEMWESINPNLSPPDLGKATTPDYPEVMQWVRVDSVSTTSIHIFDAHVGSQNPNSGSLGTFQPADLCWIFDAGTTLTVGQVVQARYMGQIQANSSASGTKTRPLYAAVAGGGGGSGTPDTETFLLTGTECNNGALITVEKTITVLTEP